MTLENFLGIAALCALMPSGALIYRAGRIFARKEKSPVVPDLKNIPPAPIQRFHRYQPTSEQKYGRDLLEISTRIYLANPATSIGPSGTVKTSENKSVEAAKRLMAEVEKICLDKDMELAEKRAKESEKMFASMRK